MFLSDSWIAGKESVKLMNPGGAASILANILVPDVNNFCTMACANSIGFFPSFFANFKTALVE